MVHEFGSFFLFEGRSRRLTCKCQSRYGSAGAASIGGWTSPRSTGQRDGLTTTEREELSRIHRELRVVREERDVLAKAIAFFTKATTR
jgi:transposase